MKQESLITLQQLAERLKCNKTTIYRLAAAKEIPYLRLGVGRRSSYRFMLSEVLNALREYGDEARY